MNMCREKVIYLELENLIRKYKECEKNSDVKSVDELLCETVKYIIDNEWTFLLDIIYPFDMDNPTDIFCGSLVIGYEPAIDGFNLMIHLPFRDIMRGQIDDEEVGAVYKMTYLKKLLPLIPCLE